MDPQQSRYAFQAESGPSKKRRLTSSHDYSIVRQNLENFGRGVVNLPTPRTMTVRQSTGGPPPAELPPLNVADRWLHEYRTNFQVVYPILNWPSFNQTYEKVYRQGSLQNVPRAWCAVLFGVFLCGSLYRNAEDGKTLLEITRSLVDFSPEDLSVDHVRSAFLLSIYQNETNARVAGWNSLGYAIRIAQSLGLHRNTGSWSVVDEEMRRRLWGSLYISDRYGAVRKSFESNPELMMAEFFPSN